MLIRSAVLLVILLSGLLTPAWPQAPVFTPDPSQQEQAESVETVTGAELDPVEAIIQILNPRRRIAQLMLVTMQGLQGPQIEDLGLLRDYTPGGVIIRQILKPSIAANYVTKLRATEAASGLPLFIGTNLYQLTRRDRGAPSGFVQLPSPLSVAAADDPEITEGLARLLAEHLKVMGFNLHMGPVLELAPELPDAPGSIYCFGSDPDFAGRAGIAMQSVFAEYGVLSMPMGFPGGGQNRKPRTQAVLLTPKPLLRQADLRPYLDVIDAGAQIIHVGNTLVPTLDDLSRPASLSPAVMRELLRRDLGFEGVIVAGPLDSEDILSTHDAVEAAQLALEGGADLLYWLGPDNQMKRVIERLAFALTQGELSEDLVNAALRRVLTLKLGLAKGGEIKESKADALSGKKKLLESAFSVERRAITLVQNIGGILPLSKAGSMPIGVTGVTGVEELQKALEKHIKPIAQQRISTARHLGDIQDFEVKRVTGRVRGLRTGIVILTDTMRPEGQVKLIRGLKQQGVKVVLILLGYPRHLALLSEADAILLAYCDDATFGETLRAMADILVGRGPVGIRALNEAIELKAGDARVFNARDIIHVPSGRLPVTVSELYRAGLAVPYDPTDAIKRADWDFGNGKRSRNERVEFTYDTPGDYAVTLSVTDRQNETTSRIFQIRVVE